MYIRASRELRMGGGNRMPLEDADEQPMRRRRTIAIVRNVSGHDIRTGNIAVHQRLRCVAWLEPMDTVEVA